MRMLQGQHLWTLQAIFFFLEGNLLIYFYFVIILFQAIFLFYFLGLPVDFIEIAFAIYQHIEATKNKMPGGSKGVVPGASNLRLHSSLYMYILKKYYNILFFDPMDVLSTVFFLFFVWLPYVHVFYIIHILSLDALVTPVLASFE
jgi:hypothetical protein